MNTIDLTFVADALIALADPFPRRTAMADRRYVPFTHDTEERQILLALEKSAGDGHLLNEEVHEICRRAKLTRRQSAVLSQKMSGLTFEEIGGSKGGTKQSAQRVFLQAITRLARSSESYPYSGLSDVYREETRRGLVARR